MSIFSDLRFMRQVKLPKENNFDLLRFCFAAMVFFVHAYQLSGAPELSIFADLFSSSIAVQCFFVVSGFLIFMSYENSSSLGNYLEKRARRIYPAYFTVVVLSALFCVFVSSYSWVDYYGSIDFYKYLAANLVFLNFIQASLPGVFAENQLVAVNGALWTLKIEVMFYLSVPLLIWLFRKLGLWQGLLLAYAGSVLYKAWMGQLIDMHGGIYVELQRQLPGQLMYFVAGGALYYYFDQFKARSRQLLLLAVGGLIIEHYLQPGFLHAASLAVIVVYLAFIFKYMGNFGRFGDFSYGVYILHAPILQVLIVYGVFDQPWLAFLVACLLVMVTAYIMWHRVEKPALRSSSHYVKANH